MSFKPTEADTDPAVRIVRSVMRDADPNGRRLARVVRASIDDLLDGSHTGRFEWSDLTKTERFHASCFVETNMQREFGFPDGNTTPFAVGGIDVICVFAVNSDPWVLSAEADKGLALLIRADDSEGWCELAIDLIAQGDGNDLDRRKSMEPDGASLTWVHQRVPMTMNVLSQLSVDDRRALLAKPLGQQRVNELFRLVQGRKVTPSVLATVAMQKDYLKRVRYNGGARTHLRKEGIVILGDSASHRKIAEALDLPAPGDGEFVSVRLVPCESDVVVPRVHLNQATWRLATKSDPIHEAPTVQLNVAGD